MSRSSPLRFVWCSPLVCALACGDREPLAVDSSVVQIELTQEWLGAPVEKRCTTRYATTTLTFDRPTKSATWLVCEQGEMVRRARTLNDDEAGRVEGALGKITYESDPACDGHDGLLHHMDTTAKDGTVQTYVDANINCGFHRRAPQVREAYEVLLGLRP